MFAIRIYIALLDLLLLAAILLTRGGGVLEFTFVSLPPLYMILEMREELGDLELLRRKLLRPGVG